MSSSRKKCMLFATPQPIWNSPKDVEKILDALQKKSVIHRIVFETNSLSPSAALSIAKKLERHSELREVVLNNVFEGRSTSEIADCLQNLINYLINGHISLTVLELRNNIFGRLGLINVGKLIQSAVCTNLKELCLEACDLTCNQMQFFCELPPRLRILRLGHNRIGDIGTKLLCKTLKELTTLQLLDLSNNSFYDSGLLSIKNYLLKTHHLRIINLSHNVIAITSAERLAKSFENALGTLRVIILRHCSISGKAAILICTALKNYKRLERVDLSFNHIDCDSVIWLFDFFIEMKLLVCELYGNQLSTVESGKVIQKIAGINLPYVICPFDGNEKELHYYQYSSTEKKMIYVKEVCTVASFTFNDYEAQVTLNSQESDAGENPNGAAVQNEINIHNDTIVEQEYANITKIPDLLPAQETSKTSQSLSTNFNQNEGREDGFSLSSSKSTFRSCDKSLDRDDNSNSSKSIHNNFPAKQLKELKEKENLCERKVNVNFRESHLSSSSEDDNSLKLKRSPTHFNLHQQKRLKQSYRNVVTGYLSSSSSESDENVGRIKVQKKNLFRNLKIIRPSSQFCKFSLPTILEVGNENSVANNGEDFETYRNLPKTATKINNKHSSDDTDDCGNNVKLALSNKSISKKLYRKKKSKDSYSTNNAKCKKMQNVSGLSLDGICDSASDNNKKSGTYFKNNKSEKYSNGSSFSIFRSSSSIEKNKKFDLKLENGKYEEYVGCLSASLATNEYNAANNGKYDFIFENEKDRDESVDTITHLRSLRNSYHQNKLNVISHNKLKNQIANSNLKNIVKTMEDNTTKNLNNDLTGDLSDQCILYTVNSSISQTTFSRNPIFNCTKTEDSGCNNFPPDMLSNNITDNNKKKLDVIEENSTTLAIRKLLQTNSAPQNESVLKVPVTNFPPKNKPTIYFSEFAKQLHACDNSSTQKYLNISIDELSKDSIVENNNFDAKNMMNFNTNSINTLESIFQTLTVNKSDLQSDGNVVEECYKQYYISHLPNNSAICETTTPSTETFYNNSQLKAIESLADEKCCSEEYKTEDTDKSITENNVLENKRIVILKSEISDMFCDVYNNCNTSFERKSVHNDKFKTIDLLNKTEELSSATYTTPVSCNIEEVNCWSQKVCFDDTEDKTQNLNTTFNKRCFFYDINLGVANIGEYSDGCQEYNVNEQDVKKSKITLAGNIFNADLQKSSLDLVPVQNVGSTVLIHFKHSQNPGSEVGFSLANILSITGTHSSDNTAISARTVVLKQHVIKYGLDELKKLASLLQVRGYILNVTEEDLADITIKFKNMVISCCSYKPNMSPAFGGIEGIKVHTTENNTVAVCSSFKSTLKKRIESESSTSSLVKSSRARYKQVLGNGSVKNLKMESMKSKRQELPTLLKKYERIAAKQTRYLSKISEIEKSRLRQLNETKDNQMNNVLGKECLKDLSNNSNYYVEDANLNKDSKLINNWPINQVYYPLHDPEGETHNNSTGTGETNLPGGLDWDLI